MLISLDLVYKHMLLSFNDPGYEDFMILVSLQKYHKTQTNICFCLQKNEEERQ